jgi:hypothetical protein
MVGGDYEHEVTDATLRAEIELLADVIAAAAQVVGRLSDAQLDHALGLAERESA